MISWGIAGSCGATGSLTTSRSCGPVGSCGVAGIAGSMTGLVFVGAGCSASGVSKSAGSISSGRMAERSCR